MHEPMTLAPNLTVCADCTTWGRYVLWTECPTNVVQIVRTPSLVNA